MTDQDFLYLIVGLFVIVYALLMFLAPFFWYGTNKRCAEISRKMDTLIALMQRDRIPPTF